MRLFEGTPWDRPPRCDRCGQLEADCTCPPPEPERIPPGEQTAKLAVEKRAKGKLATIVRGLDGGDLAELLTQMKDALGAGGTVKEGAIEIQGRHLERIRELLRQLGYRVKG